MTVPFIPIELIDPPNPVLRRFAENTVEFLELVSQIDRFNGSLQAPPVRPIPGGRYQIIDGYRRYRATLKSSVKAMPVRIVHLNDEDYLAAQIACNASHKDTDWVDYALHLDRLRTLTDEEMSLSQLAAISGMSSTWVQRVLRLNELIEPIRIAVRRGEIKIGNAHWLARLPHTEQHLYINDAKTMPVRQFSAIIRSLLNDYREVLRQGRLEFIGTDSMRPVMRDLHVIEKEMETPEHLPVLIAAAGVSNPIDVAKLTLDWAFRMDPKSLEERAEKLNEIERQRLNDYERRRYSRDKKRKS